MLQTWVLLQSHENSSSKQRLTLGFLWCFPEHLEWGKTKKVRLCFLSLKLGGGTGVEKGCGGPGRPGDSSSPLDSHAGS